MKLLKGAVLALILGACSGDSSDLEPVNVPISIEVSVPSASFSALRSLAIDGTVTTSASVIDKGVLYANEANIGFDDSKKSAGPGSGNFTVKLANISLNSDYFFRTYAITEEDSLISDEVTFNTSISAAIAKETMSTVSAHITGTIPHQLENITKYSGIIWGTTANPTIENGQNLPLTAGDFDLVIENLTPNTKYYFRTFLILENDGDTIYSQDVIGSTWVDISTKEMHAVAARFAIAGAEINGTNGATELLGKGICWSTSPEPTIEDTKVEFGTEVSSFDTPVKSLEGNTTYYLRAYATNEEATVYGEEVSFETPEQKKIVFNLNMSDEPTTDQLDAYIRITHSMNTAVEYYDEYTNCFKWVTANYNPGVPTADANNEGWMRFGTNRSFMNVRTCLHEIAHTVGIGTNPSFRDLMEENIWTGAEGTKVVRELSGNPNAVINQYGVHIGPYGLNFDREGTSHEDFVNHCLLIEAMRKDGL